MIFTDRSKAVCLLFINFVIYDSRLSLNMLYFLFLAGWERLPLGSLVCDVPCVFVTFPYDISGQVWYLIASIPDLYILIYFRTYKSLDNNAIVFTCSKQVHNRSCKRLYQPIKNLMNCRNATDGLQSHLHVKYTSNGECIRQKWQCITSIIDGEPHLVQNKPDPRWSSNYPI